MKRAPWGLAIPGGLGAVPTLRCEGRQVLLSFCSRCAKQNPPRIIVWLQFLSGELALKVFSDKHLGNSYFSRSAGKGTSAASPITVAQDRTRQ